MTNRLFFLPATRLIDLYGSGEVSPVEVVDAVLDRISEVNPRLNAFVLVDGERARDAARRSERRWRENRPLGLLDGVPVSVKDLLLTRGWPTLKGSRAVSPEEPWDDDAPAVARLREHGAVLLGKTATPEFGHKGTTSSLLCGVTRNPWDPDLTPGGSSGGAAAAVASGMGPLALGTDGGGSIRIPCSFTGLFGHKPTFGRVAAWPLSPFGTVANVGPMTRTVADGALLFDVLAQPDPRDWYALPAPGRSFRDALCGEPGGLRVGISADFGMREALAGHARDPAVAWAVNGAARALEEAGAEVREVSIQWPRDPKTVFRTLWVMGSARLARTLTKEQVEQLDPVFRGFCEAGEQNDLHDYLDAQEAREENWIYLNRVFRDVDVLIGPTMPVLPFGADRLYPEGWEDHPFDWVPFTPPFNLTRHPAASINGGFSRGLPVGVQIVGGMYQDATVFRVAQILEDLLGLAERTPEL